MNNIYIYKYINKCTSKLDSCQVHKLIICTVKGFILMEVSVNGALEFTV